MNHPDSPDWAARAASEARDDQRRHPRPYPSTERERLLDEYEPDADMGRMEHDDKGDN